MCALLFLLPRQEDSLSRAVDDNVGRVCETRTSGERIVVGGYVRDFGMLFLVMK